PRHDRRVQVWGPLADGVEGHGVLEGGLLEGLVRGLADEHPEVDACCLAVRGRRRELSDEVVAVSERSCPRTPRQLAHLPAIDLVPDIDEVLEVVVDVEVVVEHLAPDEATCTVCPDDEPATWKPRGQVGTVLDLLVDDVDADP